MTLRAEDEHGIDWPPGVDIKSPPPSPQVHDREDYYGVPLLKRPKWRWEIALYFFLEGISAGSFLLGALASLSGNKRLRELARSAFDVSFFALLPCPPLLIADLGRPERFHHMLRVFKPTSPMNLGAWTLSAFSLPVTGIAARHLISGGADEGKSRARQVALGAAGLPFAMTMISYPGVLLSTTSTPVWSRSRFLGALMACSSIANGTAATSIALSLRAPDQNAALESLRQIENIARICEGASLAAYIVTSKDAAKPLTRGRHSRLFWVGAIGCGLLLPLILRGHTNHRRQNRSRNILRSALSLAGGLALKWAITHAGRQSADDVDATRNATRPDNSAPGWGPV